MKEYLKEKELVLEEQNTTVDGLSSNEVNSRQEKFGKNKLAEGKKTPLIIKFLMEFKDLMVIVLLVDAVISLITGLIPNEEGIKEGPWEAIIIFIVVIINAILGVVQESKAEKAIEALQEMSKDTSKVVREGHLIVINDEDLVPGDIVLLEAGDSVPADARILECASLKVEEAALTGESVPVLKTEEVIIEGENEVLLGDRKNMLYMGSNVVYGRAKAVIVATGMETEMGKIATALTQAQEGETPLQKKLNQLSKILTFLVLGICVVMFGFNLLKMGLSGEAITLNSALPSFTSAIALAVAAIPEGLAAVVTIVLSIGVTKMSKRNATIRKLTAVETLGCTQVICSDKTGTLTQNKMTVVEAYANNTYYVQNQFTEDNNDNELRLLAKGMSLCSNATVDNGVFGDPTEVALVIFANEFNMHKADLEANEPRVDELPFDSVRKMMSTKHNVNGQALVYTKGALDSVMDRTTKILENGVERDITPEDKERIFKVNSEYSSKALRVLALA